jgi:argininosuccinate lyase
LRHRKFVHSILYIMKLWQKDYPLNQKIENFTVGKDRDLDLHLAQFDVLGSLAHTQMLQTIGLLSDDELSQIQQELKDIYHQDTKR